MSRKNDIGKPMWDLLPFNSIEGIVDVLTFGANKYEPNGWMKVPDAKRRYFSALMRHIKAYRDGKAIDEESGLPHLHHALCNLVFLSELEYSDKVEAV